MENREEKMEDNAADVNLLPAKTIESEGWNEPTLTSMVIPTSKSEEEPKSTPGNNPDLVTNAIAATNYPTLVLNNPDPTPAMKGNTSFTLDGQNFGSAMVEHKTTEEIIEPKKTAPPPPPPVAMPKPSLLQKSKIRMTFPQQAVGIAPPFSLAHHYIPSPSPASSSTMYPNSVQIPQFQNPSGSMPFVFARGSQHGQPVFMMVRAPSNSAVPNLPPGTLPPGVSYVRMATQPHQQHGIALPVPHKTDFSMLSSQPSPVVFRTGSIENPMRQAPAPAPMVYRAENFTSQGQSIVYTVMGHPSGTMSQAPPSIIFRPTNEAPRPIPISSPMVEQPSTPTPVSFQQMQGTSAAVTAHPAQVKLTITPPNSKDDGDGEWMDVVHTKKLSHTVECCYSMNEKLSQLQPDLHIEKDLEFIKKRMNIRPGATYKFRVAAINSCGRGAWSEPAAFRTDDPGLPSAPTKIKISKTTNGCTNITWDRPDHIPGTLMEYSVFMNVKAPVNSSDPRAQSQVTFTQVYRGVESSCTLPQEIMQKAKLDVKTNSKPAIVFRIAAKNEKGYGAATQIRWLQ